MTIEAESPVAGMLQQASAYAVGRPWSLTAGDVVEGRTTPVVRALRGGGRPRSRVRSMAPVVAVALSVALVIALVVGLGGGAHGHRGGTPPTTVAPVVGPHRGRSVLLVARPGTTLLVISPITGKLLGHVPARWSGQPFSFAQFVTAPGARYAYVEEQEGHGGPIIVGEPLSGHGPARLVTSSGPVSIGAMALSPGGRRLAWIESDRLVVDDLASGKETSIAVRRLLPPALAAVSPVLAWSPVGTRLAVVASRWAPGRSVQVAIVEYDVVTGQRTADRLASASRRAIGSGLTGAAWHGEDLYVASQQCLPDEKCLGPGGGSPLAEIDLSNGTLVRRFPALQSVSSVAVDPATGDLVVTGQMEGPHLHPIFVNYLQVLGGRPLQSLRTVRQSGTAAWVSASALPASSAAARRTVAVPHVVAWHLGAAEAFLELAGLRVRLESVPLTLPPIGDVVTVVSQLPAAGSVVPVGSVVTLRLHLQSGELQHG